MYLGGKNDGSRDWLLPTQHRRAGLNYGPQLWSDLALAIAGISGSDPSIGILSEKQNKIMLFLEENKTAQKK